MEPIERLRLALAERYRVERELGAGGMATVYLAEDLKHHRKVAIKVMRPELVERGGGERFLREIEIAASLQHPHILTLLDSGDADGVLYFVMPWVDGESLARRLERERQLPIDEALRITQEVATALGYAHSHGVVHRDIKPDNILLTGGHAVVADFGIARAIGGEGRERLTGTGLALGTPAYMSPEQAAGDREVDARADVYSLGCVLYEMLAGEPPHVAATPQALLAKKLSGTVPSVSVLRETVPAEIERVLTKALARVPADRWSGALPMAEALLAAGTGGDSSPPRRPRKPRVVWWAAIPPLPRYVLLGVAIVSALIGTGVLVRRIGRADKSGKLAQAAFDVNRFAVAPFRVVGAGADPSLSEGMAELVASMLDGAGPLTPAPFRLVAARGPISLDTASFREASVVFGAGVVVGGQLFLAGDSVRLRVAIYEAASRRILRELQWRSNRDQVDRLGDSVALHAVRVIGGARGAGGQWRLSELGSSSLSARKAYLRGLYHWRRFQLDSATTAFGQALDADSGFALAWQGLAQSQLQSMNFETLDLTSFRRAEKLNRGLPPKDSLLVTWDYLSQAAWPALEDLPSRELQDRLLAIAASATQRYGDDPEVRYREGWTLYQLAAVRSFPLDTVKAAFSRAVELDPNFGGAYPTLIAIAFQQQDVEAARRWLGRFLALKPTGGLGVGHRALALCIGESEGARREGARVRDSTLAAAVAAKGDARGGLLAALTYTWWLLDSSECGVRFWPTPPISAYALALRGYFARAYRAATQSSITPFWDFDAFVTMLGTYGGAPADRVSAIWRDSLATPRINRNQNLALRWWARQRDTLSLVRVLAKLRAAPDSMVDGTYPSDRAARRSYCLNAAQGYLALARGDTGEAIRRLRDREPQTLSWDSYTEGLTAAQLLAARGQDSAALAALRWAITPAFWQPSPEYPVIWLLRAQLNERLGNRDAARRDYQLAAAAWRNPDRQLLHYRDEALAGLARLGAKPLP